MRVLAAVVAVPVPAGRLAALERPLARAAARADRLRRRGPPGRGRLPELLGRAARRAGARGRGAVRRLGQARAEAVPHALDLQAAARVRRKRRATASSTASGQIDWRSSDPLPFDSPCYAHAADTIYAVLILAHESYHTAGVTDEAATNCFAIQAMAWTATQLGAPAGRGGAARPGDGGARARGRRAGYATTECHAGGRLDLHPETPEFPTEHPIAPPLGHGGTVGS